MSKENKCEICILYNECEKEKDVACRKFISEICFVSDSDYQELKRKLAISEKREKILRGAVKFYADADNYDSFGNLCHEDMDEQTIVDSIVISNGGKRAREALREIDEIHIQGGEQ